MSAPLVTVAVPLLDAAPHLPDLLAALLAQTYDPAQLEILLVDGGSRDGTRELARAAAQQHPHIRLLANPGRYAASALNVALRHARGAVFVRIDARTRPAPDYIEHCVERLFSGEWAGVGGPQHAVGASRAGRIHAMALNHPFGAGWPLYRRARTPRLSETLYLGAYRTDWLRRADGWDERFAANEDYELNLRLRNIGGRLLVDPAIRSDYVVRDGLAALARQYAGYGAWRTATWRLHGRGAVRARHTAPALLTAALMIALLVAPRRTLPLLAGYLGVDAAVCAGLSVRHGPAAFLRLLITFPTLHLAWGVGFWWALLRPPGSNGRRISRRSPKPV